MAHINFNASEVPPEVGAYEPMHAGWYHSTIVGAEMTYGKSVDAGLMLKLQVEINGNEHPQYANRRVFTYLCINHKNDLTKNIANRNLSSICHAIKQLELDDTDQLLGEEVMVRLKVRAAHDGYEASNDVGGFAPNGSQKTEEAPSPSQSSTDNQSGAARGAWK